jgi:hypothetical protein
LKWRRSFQASIAIAIETTGNKFGGEVKKSNSNTKTAEEKSHQ